MADFKFLRRRVYSAAKFAKNGNRNARYDTSDIAQESVLQLLNELKKNEHQELNVNSAYLDKVGQGNAHRMLRNNLAQRRSMNSEDGGADVTRLSDRQHDPVLLAQDREGVVNLIKAISQIEPGQQVVIYRRIFDQITFSEIAQEMNVTIDIVRRKYEKAIAKLKQLLS